MFLITVLVLLLAIIFNFLVWFWRLFVALRQTATEATMTLYNNKGIFGIAILITTAGVALKLEQAAVQSVLDQFYECFIFIFDQILWIFATAIRNAFHWTAIRYNDALGYFRGVLSDVRESLQILLEEDVGGVIFSKPTGNVQMISDLIELFADMYLSMVQWTISIPSFEIRFVTVSWTAVLNWVTCQEAIFFRIGDSIVRLSVFSESCHFCDFKDETGAVCLLTDFVTPGVVQNCSPEHCHDFICEEITCNLNFVSNITYLIGGDNATQIFPDIIASLCCIYGLLDRPFYFIVGFIEQCLSASQVADQIEKYAIEVIDCMDTWACLVTNHEYCNSFEFFANYLYKVLGIVIDGVYGMVDCMKAPEVSLCFDLWPDNCEEPADTTIQGFAHCFKLIDDCMLTYELWQPIAAFFSFWEEFMRFINFIMCTVWNAVLDIVINVCIWVNNFFTCFDNLSTDSACDLANHPERVVQCVELFLSDFSCAFSTPQCPTCPGPMGNCQSIGAEHIDRTFDIFFNYYDYSKRKFLQKDFISEHDSDILLNTILCFDEGKQKNDNCIDNCIFSHDSCSTIKYKNETNQTFTDWIRLLEKNINYKHFSGDCHKNFIYDESQYKSKEYQECIVQILNSFRRDVYLGNYPLLRKLSILSKLDTEEQTELSLELRDKVRSYTTSLNISGIYKEVMNRIQKSKYYKAYKQFQSEVAAFKSNSSLVLYESPGPIIFYTGLGAVHIYDKRLLQDIYLDLKYLNFTYELAKIHSENNGHAQLALEKRLAKLSRIEQLESSLVGPIMVLKDHEKKSEEFTRSISNFLDHMNHTYYKANLSKYSNLFRFLNEKVARILKIDRSPTYQFLHAAHYTLQTKDVSNISRWIRGEVFYIPHKGFVNKTEYDQFNDEFNPLNPRVYQPTINLSYRNATYDLGIFLTGIIFANFSFESIGSIQNLPEFFNITKNNIEKRMIYEYSKHQTFLAQQNPADFSFDTWFTVSFVGGIMNRVFGVSKTFFYDWIVQGIDFLESLDWKKTVLDPILFWSSNTTNCIWPGQVNGTSLYNPFCLPFVYEQLFRFLEPLPNGIMPTQINWPIELIDVENGGQCKNTYTGNSNFIFTFHLSDNCAAQTQNFGRAVGFMGDHNILRIALISSPQDGFYGSRSGLIYTYKENKTSPSLNHWTLHQQIEAIDTTQPERIGLSISIYEDFSMHRVVFGSPGAQKKVGLIRVFDFDQTTGLLNPLQNISAPDIPFIGFSTRLGISTTIDDTLIVGGVPSFNSERGAALVYQLNSTTQQYNYIQVIELPADQLLRDNTQFFGTAVRLEPSEGLLFMGAPNFPVIPFSLLGYPTSNNGIVIYYAFDGLANRFDTDNPAKIEPTGTGSDLHNAFFGSAITSDGEYLMISAPGYSGGKGAVYIYHDDCFFGTCYDLKDIKVGTVSNEGFGSCIHYKEPYLIVGAPGSSLVVVYIHTAPHNFNIVTTYVGSSDFVGASCYVNNDKWIAGGPAANSGAGIAKSRTTNSSDSVAVATFHPTTTPVDRPNCHVKCDYCKRKYVTGAVQEVVFGFTQALQPCEVVGFNDALDVTLFGVSYSVNVLNTFIFGGVSFKFISDYGLVAIVIATLIFSGFTYLIVIIPLFFIVLWLLNNMFGEFLPVPILVIGCIILGITYGFFSISITSNAVPILLGFVLLVTWIVFLIGGWGEIQVSFTQELLDLVNSFQRNPITSWIPGLDILAYRIPLWIYPNNQIPSVDIFCFYLNFGELGLAFLAGFGIYYVAYLIIRALYVTWLFIWATAVLLALFIRDMLNAYFSANPTPTYLTQQRLQQDVRRLRRTLGI